jgi:hypothetical protein
MREARLARARRGFHAQRERLEAKFVHLAAAVSSDDASSDAPHWADCDFDDDVAYVRDRRTGQLSAFVGVTVAVSSLEGPASDINGLVGNLRVGTAVFRFDRDHWETDGQAMLNLSPSEAIRALKNDLEMVDREVAQGS